MTRFKWTPDSHFLLDIMDTHAFASLAHIRILLLPVGTISQSSFENYAAEIRSFETLRLGDIPSDGKDERGTSIL